MISDDQYKKIFGEVFTPKALVDEMLDKLPAELWGNKELKWCDPACGSGNFLYHVKLRLMEGLAEVIPDEDEREKHIVENMLYGVELQRKNTYLCMFKLDPDNKFKTNIVCANSLEFDFWGGMKFDVVLGNPPYQEMSQTGGRGSKRNNLYSKFMELAMDVLLYDGGYLVFITPRGWMTSGSKNTRFFSERTAIFVDVNGADPYFKGIGSSFSWFVIHNSRNTQNLLTEIRSTFQKKVYTSRVLMKSPFYPMLITTESIAIFNKTVFSDTDKMEFSAKSFNHEFEKNILSKEKDDAHPYLVHHTPTQILYAQKEPPNYGCYKVICPLTTYWEKLGVTTDGVTENFRYIIAENQEEAERVKSILHLKLFRFIINMTRWSNFNVPGVMNLLPKVDFSTEWTDQNLYSHFNLTAEEITLIEETVS